MTETEMKPPVTVVGPLAWLRKNLFSTWYNALLTFLVLWLLYALLRPAYEWATTEARWGVIEANLTLFMVGQYPREQIGRVWLAIFLGAGVAFALISLYFQWDVVDEWVLAVVILLALFVIGRFVPRGSLIATLGWLLYFPIVFLLIAGTRYIATLPPVEPTLWGGLMLTLLLAVVGNLCALPLGILLALGRRSKLPVIRTFCIGYIELIRHGKAEKLEPNGYRHF